MRIDSEFIKAIFFDWGGVLIEHPTNNILSYCAGALGISRDKLIEVYQRYHISLQTGEADEKALWEDILRSEGKTINLKESLWQEAFSAAYSPRENMFKLVRRLRGNGYKVGLISNTESPAAKLFLEKHKNEFDSTIFSCNLGIIKPYARIYYKALESLDVLAEKSVFIDDLEENIKGAENIGMKGILYKSYEQVIDELRGIGVRADS